MATFEKLTTIVSTKGQVILPKAVREHRKWPPGTKLIVEDTLDGVLLRAAPVFAPARPDDVFGCLKSCRPAITLEQMGEAIAMEVRRRHARGRY